MPHYSKSYIELKKRIVAGKVYYRQQYLKDLSCLLQRNVTFQELLPLEQTDIYLQSVSKWNLVWKKTFQFADKELLFDFVSQNISIWETSYLIYLSDVRYCGMLKIDSLSCFNWNFHFTDESHGMIFFIREDLREKLLLDFYEEDFTLFIDVELYRP